MKWNKSIVFLLISSILAIVIGAGLWISFHPIFSKLVAENLILTQNNDESMAYSTYMYTHPPIKNVLKFYFFNVTNPDEVVYNGALPEIVEVGGYAFLESEEKKYTSFSQDKSKLFYQNYKKYKYSPENNDVGLDYDDLIYFPNPTAMGAFSTVFSDNSNISIPMRQAISLAFLLIGEYPLTVKRVKDIIFEGFNDPLLDIGHSPIIKIMTLFLTGENLLDDLVPSMETFAFFNNYNNTFDENYVVNTGYDDVNKLGVIESWADRKELPFWTTEETRTIRGSDSGSLCKMHLTEDDKLPLFMSFMCRSFTKTFAGTGSVDGIDTMIFSVPYEDYDTTLQKNQGYRYKNPENVNYYPNWPDCSRCEENSTKSDCKLCGGGNIVNGTYLLPPGIYPLTCYPGHIQSPPFMTLMSPPHFLYSPKQVQESLVGINPDPKRHSPLQFHHEQYTGSVLQVDVRLQINVPLFPSKNSILTEQMPTIMFPLFWQDSHSTLHDYVYNKLWFGVILIPQIIQWISWVLLFIGIVMLLIVVYLYCRQRGKHNN